MNYSDTIAAIATPAGEGGIAVIRISGPEARSIAERVFRARSGKGVADFRGYSTHYGFIVDPYSAVASGSIGAPEEEEALDDALLTVFRSPRSYTGEDVCELSCHGGSSTARRVLDVVLQAGARSAEPGEFTQRAFLNGKMDLAQAEAVADLIRARTESARRLARRQLDGQLSRAVAQLKEDLIGILAAIEVTIDFSDEVGELDNGEIASRLLESHRDLVRLQHSAGVGRILRDGISVAIVGRPNVGKSSLLNALLRCDRAIVTAVPGTTRDTIEESVTISGLPIALVDTAGMRETRDDVERIGVERSRDALIAADVALYVLDCEAGVTPEDVALVGTVQQAARQVVVWNKRDLVDDSNLEGLLREAPALLGMKEASSVAVSASAGTGIEALEDEIVRPYLSVSPVGETALADPIGSAVAHAARHLHALESARKSIWHALDTARAGMPGDFTAIDIRGALDSLGLITGETVTDDIIHRIFKDFCVGK